MSSSVSVELLIGCIVEVESKDLGLGKLSDIWVYTVIFSGSKLAVKKDGNEVVSSVVISEETIVIQELVRKVVSVRADVAFVSSCGNSVLSALWVVSMVSIVSADISDVTDEKTTSSNVVLEENVVTEMSSIVKSWASVVVDAK